VSRRVVLLDKDGTLVENVPMNADPARIRLTPGVPDALLRLSAAGFRIAVVSNQSGVAFGHFTEEALRDVEERMRELLAQFAIELDGFFYCPHHPDALVERYRCICNCRKPAPGLLATAATRFHASPERIWMVGDILDDVEAAHRAGCRAILFDSGGETEWMVTPLRRPEFVVTRFEQVADVILGAPRNAA
jgi:D-glycero-D-manno-heptose 1,7-bisphosphate phosphatase